MITQAELDTFVAACNAAQEAHAANSKIGAYIISAQVGKKFAKIVKTSPLNPLDRSAFCFVDMETGTILKAASWAAPAKGARGHISNGATQLTPYGAIYLK